MAQSVSGFQIWKPEIDAYELEEKDIVAKSTVYNKLARVKGTDRLQINEVTVAGYGPMVAVGELGDAVEDNALEAYAFSYNSQSYRKKTVFSSDLLETDQHDAVRDITKDFVRTLEYSRDLNFFSMFRNGWNTGITYGDSKQMISIAHPRKDGGTSQANTFADGIQRELTYDNVLRLQDQMISVVSDSGSLLNAGATGKNLTLMVPPYLRSEAFQIAGIEGPDYKPGTNENDMNYIRKGEKYDVLIVDWLKYEAARQAGETGTVTKTSASNYWDKAWFLLDQELAAKYLKFYYRNGYPKSDYKDNLDNQALIKYAFDKYAYGMTHWMFVSGSKGDGSTLAV